MRTINFAEVNTMQIPEGDVQSLSIAGMTVWQKAFGDWRDLYDRVDYIANASRGQYIVTDYTADNTTGLEVTIACNAYEDVICAGSRISGSNARFYTPYLYASSRQYYGWNTARTLSLKVGTNTKFTARLNWMNSRKAEMMDSGGSLLGSASFGTTKLATQKDVIALFCSTNGDGSFTSRRNMKLYGARISQGGEVVREYIPCMRKSDGELGVFEACTETFITRSGSGSFTYGEIIGWL